MPKIKENKAKTHRLTINLTEKQVEQIEGVKDLLCQTSLAESVRYLITRGLAEEITRASLRQSADAQSMIARALQNPDLPEFNEMLKDLKI